jgi:pimeloyl-ACP methyl ester carboxylesterase
VPLLLLASRGDALVDPRCSLAIAQRWACEIAMHPWAGHDLPLDDADWVVQQVRERTA